MSKALSLALLLAALGGGAASAATVDPTTALKDFNAIIFNNAFTNSDIEGAAVVGGNFSGATVFNKSGVTTEPGYGALTVFGSTTGNSINIDNGGTAYVAGNKGANISFNGGAYTTSPPPNTISDFETAFTNFSQSLLSLAVTSTLPAADNNEVIVATPNSQGVAVFDITAAQLDSIPSYSFDLNGATSVVFNVSGTSVNFGANAEGAGASAFADDVIWNFYQATSVHFGAEFGGSVIAPLATVSSNSSIDGAVVASSLNVQGELHDYPYTGTPPISPPPTVSAAPEPASWALMLVGVGGVGLALRTRRRQIARAAVA